MPSSPWKRVKTPSAIQIEGSEGAAVILRSLLEFYGRNISIEDARQAVNLSRSGTSADDFVKAAESYGLEAKGWSVDLEDLPAIKPPFVIFWSFRHYVIVEGTKTHTAYVNDPRTGPQRISVEDLDRNFTGVVLTMAPGKEFKTGGERPNLLKSILSRFPSGGKVALAFLVTAGIAIATVGVYPPIFQRIFVDKFLGAHLDANWVVPMLWIMGLSAVLVALIQWFKSYVLMRFWILLSMDMEAKFLWHMLHLPLTFFSNRYAGDLAHRTVTNSKVAALLTGQFAETLINMITILPYALLLLTYNWILAIIGFVIAATNMIVLKLVARMRTSRNTTYLQQQGILNGTIIAGIMNIETIKAAGGENNLFQRLVGTQSKIVTMKQELVALTQILRQAPVFLNQLNVTAILVLGGLMIITGDFTIGYLIAFQAFMASFTLPFAELTLLGAQVQTASGEIYRLDDVLTEPVETLDDGATSIPDRDEERIGEIELRNVTFGYEKDSPPLLDGVSLKIRPGTKTALVGASGCGKSTLISLVMGLLQPWSGEILYDGVPRSKWPRAELGKRLGYVSQEVFLFSGTIHSNLTFTNPATPMADVTQACRDACIHEDITSKPGGYKAPVLTGGKNLSGGQCQRMEIARALAQNPTYLILDEATSALDTVTEEDVSNNIVERGISCLVAAHRLSTIRDSQEIIVLDHGQIVERGSHEELTALNGRYVELLHS
ncbi:MAG: ATP-binding cassette domain-containing protein [Puniceicoccales bacterium]